MNWLTNFIRPKIRSLTGEQKEVPDNLWQKCPACEGMLFHRDLREHLNVCYHCGHHMKIDVASRLRLIFDEGRYTEVAAPKVAADPLKFKDRKRYADRIKESRAKTGRDDAIVIARGTMGGIPVVIAAFDFEFMGGSMGAAVGEGIVAAAHTAVQDNAALIVIPASGGARMQEGMISLMQMPRSIVAVEQVKMARLPYVVLLTDPTTGGVSASFAMVGDIHIAEPGCTIGFAGKRVIQETIREELPKGFQTAEYLLAHGMVDMVVPRKDHRETLIRLFDLLLRKDTNDRSESDKARNGNGKNGKKDKGGKNGGNVVALKKKIAASNTVPAPAAKKARAR
jgi:acetyl-CoA carboxylase carboxyl transferase subunit beta